MNLTKLSIKRPVSVIIVVVALVIFGAMSIFTSPMELTPDMEIPVLLTMTTYPGAGPEDVEELVSQKIEDGVSTINGVKNIQSQSSESVSIVILQMEYGTNMDVAHMDLQENLNMVKGQLPDDVSDPIILEMDMNAMPSITLSVQATGDMNLLNYVSKEVKPDFEKLSGVAKVDVYGGNSEYISVKLMDDRMRQYGITLDTLVTMLKNADFSLPGDSVDMGSQSLAVHTSVKYRSAEELRGMPLTLNSGKTIHLSDIAAITSSTKEAESISRYNGQENVTLSVSKRQNASTLSVSKAVINEMNKINASDSGVQMEIISDSSEMIKSSVQSVFSTLLLGIVLSMAVLFLFFGDMKASLIVGSSMPISLLVTVILMRLMGFSLNLVSLGGMVVGVGMMVDNSTVVIESCFRRSTGAKQDFKQIALEGTQFVAASIVASTITSVVVFLPISLLNGLSGQLFKQLGFTIIFSLTASLVCALTLVPLFFTIFKPKEHREAPFNRFMHRVEIGYGNLLTRILPHKIAVVLTAVVLLAVSILTLKGINIEMMPQVDEGTVSVEVETRPGLQLDQIDTIMTQVEALAASHPDVERYSLTGGGGNMMSSANSSTLTAYLKDNRAMSTKEVVEQWRNDTSGYLGCQVNVSASSGSMGSMGGSGIAVNLQGNDFDTLKTAAAQVEDVMRKNTDIVRVTSTASKGNPQATVKIDPIKAAAKGLMPKQIGGTIYNTLHGVSAFTLNSSGTEYDVFVEYPKERYQTVNDLTGMMLTNAGGVNVPLTDVASIEFSDSPQSIARKNNQYIVTVTGTPTEAAKFDAKKVVMAQAKSLELPAGVSIAPDDNTEQMVEEFTSLGVAIAIAVLLVFMVMAMQFESPKFSTMVMLCIPFSLIGCFGLLFLSGATLSMPAMMGFLTLSGTVVNNGILFVDTTNQYRRSMDIHTALINAGRTRLRPILITTLTTVLSMVPMAIGIGSGSEMMRGMAVVIIGGLTASTVLTLLLLPTFYLIFNRKADKNDPPAQPITEELEEQIAGLDY